jgi:hypothetical protein
MKTLVVFDGNCGDEAAEYRKWLEKNLPDDVKLDWRERISGIGDGLFDKDWNELDDPYWTGYCNS